MHKYICYNFDYKLGCNKKNLKKAHNSQTYKTL